MSYEDTLIAEAASWVIPNDVVRTEKFRRERMRHFGMAKALLLDKLGTDLMDVLEVGGGPMPLSDLLRFRSRTVIDPLSDEYRKVIECPDHLALKAEEMTHVSLFDLAIATNSLDHVEKPELVVRNMDRALRPGGYLAILCAQDNALTNPHPAHVHNLTEVELHRWLDADYETVWELTYERDGFRYGWVPYEGKRGQPAFALLMRKCSGYTS